MTWIDHWKKYIKPLEKVFEHTDILSGNKLYSTQEHKLFSFYFAYEDETYCEEQLIRLINRSITDFALTPDEQIKMDHTDAWDRMKQYEEVVRKKGATYITGWMYGEALLYALLTIFFPDVAKMSTKIKVRTAIGAEVHWFDCAHYQVKEDWSIALWLWEAKFYADYKDAIKQAVISIKQHIEAVKLKEEFIILRGHLEWPDKDVLENEIVNKVIDDLHIVVPVLITYDSTIMGKYKTDDSVFLAEIEKEFTLVWNEYIWKKIEPWLKKIDIYLMALPFLDIQDIKAKLIAVKDANL